MLPTLFRRDPFFSDIDRPLDAFRQQLGEWMNSGEAPTAAYPVDIREDDDHFYVDAEMPGFTKDQVNVTLENGLLSIEAARQLESDGQKKGEVHLQERRYTRIRRAFKLPTAVDENTVKAELRDGILHLMLSKREEVKPRRIDVK